MEINAQDVYRVVLKGYPDVLTVKQVSEILRVCEKTVYKLIAEGRLPIIKVGRQFRITKVSALKYLKTLEGLAPENLSPTI